MRKLRNALAAKAKELDASRQGIHAVQEQAHKLRKHREDRVAERVKLEQDSTQVGGWGWAFCAGLGEGKGEGKGGGKGGGIRENG